MALGNQREGGGLRLRLTYPRVLRLRRRLTFPRHARPCAGHPRPFFGATRTWMAGTSPAMTARCREPGKAMIRSRRPGQASPCEREQGAITTGAKLLRRSSPFTALSRESAVWVPACARTTNPVWRTSENPIRRSLTIRCGLRQSLSSGRALCGPDELSSVGPSQFLALDASPTGRIEPISV